VYRFAFLAVVVPFSKDISKIFGRFLLVGPHSVGEGVYVFVNVFTLTLTCKNLGVSILFSRIQAGPCSLFLECLLSLSTYIYVFFGVSSLSLSRECCRAI
jgi:hypothetical protein